MDHAASFCDTSDAAGLSAEFKFDGDGFSNRIRCHDTFCRQITSVCAKSFCKFRNAFSDRGNIQRLSDNTGRCNYDIRCFNLQFSCCKRCHFLSHSLSVRRTGVGVSTVTDNCLCLAVSNMLLGNGNRRSLYQVRRINCCAGTGSLTHDQREISFILVLTDPAADPVCCKSFCGTNAAFNHLHSLPSLFIR